MDQLDHQQETMMNADLHTFTEPPPPRGCAGPPLAIKANNASFTEACGVCGEPTTAMVPYAILMRQSSRAVCDGCAERIEPALAWMLWAYYSAGGGV